MNGNVKSVESKRNVNTVTQQQQQKQQQPNYENTLNDQHLLREYGIDFSNFSITMSNNTNTNQSNASNCDPFNINNKKQWTTFD